MQTKKDEMKEESPLAPDMKRIFTLINRIMRRNIDSYFERVLDGVSKSEFGVLMAILHSKELDKSGGECMMANQMRDVKLTVSQLAESFKVSSPAISRMLKNLEEKGLVERFRESGDKRNTYVRFTEKGKKECLQAQKNSVTLLQNVIEQVGNERFGEMLDTLDLFFEKLEAEVLKI